MTLTIEKPAHERTAAREEPEEQLGKVIPLAEAPAPDGPEGGENGPVDREPPRPDRGGRRDDRPPRPPRWRRLVFAAMFGLMALLMLGAVLEILREPKERET